MSSGVKTLRGLEASAWTLRNVNSACYETSVSPASWRTKEPQPIAYIIFRACEQGHPEHLSQADHPTECGQVSGLPTQGVVRTDNSSLS